MEFPEFEEGKSPLDLLRCKQYSIIGIETEAPILIIDNLVFRGTFEYQMGTTLLFNRKIAPLSGKAGKQAANKEREEGESGDEDDLQEAVSETTSLFQEEQPEYFDKCHKKIVFRSVKINPKTEPPPESLSSSSLSSAASISSLLNPLNVNQTQSDDPLPRPPLSIMDFIS